MFLNFDTFFSLDRPIQDEDYPAEQFPIRFVTTVTLFLSGTSAICQHCAFFSLSFHTSFRLPIAFSVSLLCRLVVVVVWASSRIQLENHLHILFYYFYLYISNILNKSAFCIDWRNIFTNHDRLLLFYYKFVFIPKEISLTFGYCFRFEYLLSSRFSWPTPILKKEKNKIFLM